VVQGALDIWNVYPHDSTVVRLPHWMEIYFPERIRIAEALCDPKGKTGTLNIVDDLIILCRDVQRNIYYPGEILLSKTCSSCHTGCPRYRFPPSPNL
jgi:hypothetical protein